MNVQKKEPSGLILSSLQKQKVSAQQTFGMKPNMVPWTGLEQLKFHL